MNLVSISIPYLYILHVMVISIRVGSTLMFAPIWGNPGLPQQMKIMLIFSISAAVSVLVPFNPDAYLNPGLIIPTELLIGLLLTMGIRIAFAGLHMAGSFVGFHLGFSMVQAIDPGTMNRSALMSTYFTLLGYVILLASNQHHSMFRALSESYKAFPIGASISTAQWFPSLMNATKEIFVIGWKIALPVFVVSLVIEVTVAFLSRVQPQLSAMVVTAPLKLLIGMLVLGASLTFIPRVIAPALETMVLRR